MSAPVHGSEGLAKVRGVVSGMHQMREHRIYKSVVATNGQPIRRPLHLKPTPVKVELMNSWPGAGQAMSTPLANEGGQRSFAPRLVLMVKEPKAGLVKTRLAQGTGVVRATSFYRNSMNALFARLADHPGWETYIAVTPDAAIDRPTWPKGAHRFAQGGGDLGQRMQRIFNDLPPGPVVIVGTDVPALSVAHIQQAFRRLGSDDAVFGRAPDGGYWLIGMKRRPNVPKAFHGVRWSSSDALEDTMENLKNYRVSTLGNLVDVDAAEDLQLLGQVEGRHVLPANTN